MSTTPTTVHFAMLQFEGEPEIYYFASLDGELFLGASRIPTPDDIPAVQALFDTKGKTTLPMRIHKNLLRRQGAHFGWVTDEPSTVKRNS